MGRKPSGNSKRTIIAIDRTTKELLDRLVEHKSDSYDTIIKRLIEKIEKKSNNDNNNM